MEHLGSVQDSFAETATPFSFESRPAPNSTSVVTVSKPERCHSVADSRSSGDLYIHPQCSYKPLIGQPDEGGGSGESFLESEF